MFKWTVAYPTYGYILLRLYICFRYRHSPFVLQFDNEILSVSAVTSVLISDIVAQAEFCVAGSDSVSGEFLR